MYRIVQQSLLTRIEELVAQKYDISSVNLVFEQPPSIALGELALPLAFELAKRLRKAPRAIAAELAADLTASLPEGIASIEAAGAGYLNIRFNACFHCPGHCSWPTRGHRRLWVSPY